MSKGAERALRSAAALFFALGDDTRLALVHKLGAGDALSATQLAEGASVSRQAIMKHLRALEEVGLVSKAKHGREVLYSLEPRRVDDAGAFLNAISAAWDRAIGRLRRHVES